MIRRIANDLEQAIEANHGIIEVEGDRSEYVVMTRSRYEALVVGNEEGSEEVLAAINRGLADIDTGRTTPAAEFFAEFDRKHGLQD